MDFSKIFKNSETYKVFSNDIKTKMLNNCYLLISADSMKINNFAMYVASSLLCKEQDFPCLKCDACKKAINGHIDITVLPNEKNITVKDSNFIVEDSVLSPLEADYKIYILKDFDNATVQAQNKLLKVFEEGPKNSIFILTCGNEGNVLMTILSRCKKIYEPNLTNNELFTLLKEDFNVIERVEEVSNISGGNITIAHEYLTNAKKFDMFNISVDVICNMKTSSQILEYSYRIQKNKEYVSDFLQALLFNLSELNSLISGVELKNKNNENRFNEVIDEYNFSATKRISEIIIESAQKLQANCNVVAVIENLLLKILEVKYLCRK